MAADAATGAAARLPLADQDDESRRGPRYRPGTRLLVTFAEDPDIWHERIVLYQATLEAWAIMTAHGHEYVEHGSWWTSVELLTGRTDYPASATGQIVQFETPVGEGELMLAIRRGRELAVAYRRAHPSEGTPPSPTGALTWEGRVIAIPARGVQDRFLQMRRKQGTSADGRSAPAPARSDGPPPPGTHDGEPVDLEEALDLSAGAAKCWQVVEVLAQDPVAVLPSFGTTIDLAPGSVIRGESALACLGVNGWVACRRVLVSDAAHASDTLRRFQQPFGDDAGVQKVTIVAAALTRSAHSSAPSIDFPFALSNSPNCLEY